VIKISALKKSNEGGMMDGTYWLKNKCVVLVVSRDENLDKRGRRRRWKTISKIDVRKLGHYNGNCVGLTR
jgi:hypothetical protein